VLPSTGSVASAVATHRFHKMDVSVTSRRSLRTKDSVLVSFNDAGVALSSAAAARPDSPVKSYVIANEPFCSGSGRKVGAALGAGIEWASRRISAQSWNIST